MQLNSSKTRIEEYNGISSNVVKLKLKGIEFGTHQSLLLVQAQELLLHPVILVDNAVTVEYEASILQDPVHETFLETC